jgi:hypothetical protein
MYPCNLIAQSLKDDKAELPCEPVKAICAVTGLETLCVSRAELFGKSFTNGDLLARPDSDYVSVDAYLALKYKWERMGSWFCDGETFERLDRQGVRAKVLQADMPVYWTAYATTSYKKHGSLRARVNMGKSRVWLFEMRLVDLTDFARAMEWWDALNIALRSGIWRSIIESLECPPFVIDKIGLKTWMEFETWARPKYLSALYAFLCYLLPSQEELKLENKSEIAQGDLSGE